MERKSKKKAKKKKQQKKIFFFKIEQVYLLSFVLFYLLSLRLSRRSRENDLAKLGAGLLLSQRL